ncbi:MAG: type II toxin-antitoxin system RelE/ParE family toxin [Bifidobacteriaceae bacterium]|jgi:mRNA interferase RelE/StbE|nr:type II toxin-antitoxin system RelE/ParE family toxin [Bifidobacteriaceae bacterium]
MLSVRLEFHPTARKQFAKLSEQDKKRVTKAINGLREKPPVGDIKPLKGTVDIYRLRKGKYRIKFSRESKDEILIMKIEPRGQVYK